MDANIFAELWNQIGDYWPFVLFGILAFICMLSFIAWKLDDSDDGI